MPIRLDFVVISVLLTTTLFYVTFLRYRPEQAILHDNISTYLPSTSHDGVAVEPPSSDFVSPPTHEDHPAAKTSPEEVVTELNLSLPHNIYDVQNETLGVGHS